MRKILFFLSLIASFAFSQPIAGEGDQLTYEKDRIIYTGNVKLTRGNALLTANKVIIYLDENRKARLMEAEGNVKYVEGNIRAFADRMIYDLREEVSIIIRLIRRLLSMVLIYYLFPLAS